MIQIKYQPVIARSLKEICQLMGVSEEKVKDWVSEGAPIAVEGSGPQSRYSAEISLLQVWRLQKSQNSAQTFNWLQKS